MSRGFRQVLGYLLGGALVLAAIPSGILALSRVLDGLAGLGALGLGTLRIVLAVLLAVPGLAFGIGSIAAQNTIGKGGPLQFAELDISPRTRVLVTSGPYRYSRNPMLFGACMAYLGYALFLDSPSALTLVLAFTTFMLTVVVRSEERRLLRDFGEEYEEYRRRTSLFLPWPRKKP